VSTLRSLKRFQRASAKRGSLEEKTKIFEENARKAKLSIDMELLVQVLQEENRAHDEVIKELDEKLQEENRTHDGAMKELEEKIADLQMQIKSSSEAESIPSETPSEPEQKMTEPAQETTEPLQETPTEVDEHVSVDAFKEVRALLQESEPIESEVPPEAPKKKRRSLF
jgi:hypothetical protein